jgi:hypothetical protein
VSNIIYLPTSTATMSALVVAAVAVITVKSLMAGAVELKVVV